MAPLNIADTFSLSNISNNPFQINTNLNATANQCQTLYQPHTANIIGHSAVLLSLNPTVNPTELSPVNTQNYNLPFFAMKKSVKSFDGLDHPNTAEGFLHQNDAHKIPTMGEQLPDLVAYNQWHKREMAYIQRSVSGIALSWFLRLHEG